MGWQIKGLLATGLFVGAAVGARGVHRYPLPCGLAKRSIESLAGTTAGATWGEVVRDLAGRDEVRRAAMLLFDGVLQADPAPRPDGEDVTLDSDL